jgi:undecaprenyl diphosphate synthase
MNFNRSLLARRTGELRAEGVKITFSGRDARRVPKAVVDQMADAKERTKQNKRMTLNIAFNYGGRAEIVDAVQQLIRDKVKADQVTEKAIRQRLYHPELPDPDLIVRTSGEFRTSNFLMWESAYSELVFTGVLWPDFRREDLFDAVIEYQARNRRFGGLDR